MIVKFQLTVESEKNIPIKIILFTPRRLEL